MYFFIHMKQTRNLQPDHPSLRKSALHAALSIVSEAPSPVYGARKPMSATQNLAPADLIVALKKGFPISELEHLRRTLDLPMDRLAPLLGLSRATLHRRKITGRLSAEESDRVVRFARLAGLAYEVLESRDNAILWLSSPQFGLGGAIPLEYASTEIGAREVEDLLNRMEFGVYS